MLPILFQSHDLTLYSYPILMGIGWGVAYQIFFAFYPSEEKNALSTWLFWGTFLSSWVGAKILFLITSESTVASDWSFWTGGGFVFLGGFLGAIIYMLVLKTLGVSMTLKRLWPMLPALVFGHAIGRIGCLLAGCCFGAETHWWWGVHLHGAERHPTQLLEAIGLVGLGYLILRFKAKPAWGFSFYLIGYGVLRFGLEFLRGDAIRGFWGVFTPSQWISLALIIVGIFLIKFRALAHSE